MLYVVAGVAVLGLSAVMSMAGLGVAFLVVPLLYWMGVPLPEAASTGLLLNAISLSFASVTYWRAGLVNLAVGAPVGVAAIVGAPLGARLAPHVPLEGNGDPGLERPAQAHHRRHPVGGSGNHPRPCWTRSACGTPTATVSAISRTEVPSSPR